MVGIAASGENQFLVLFAQEARDRVAHLNQLVVDLESAPEDGELIASIFREAHTLKGGASMVGLDHLTEAWHALEDLLDTVRSGHRKVTPELVDRLLSTVDTLGELTHRATAGQDHAKEAAAITAELRQALAPDASSAAPASLAVAVAPVPEHHVIEAETLQVNVTRIDQLVRLVGESAAAQLRIGRMIGTELKRDPETIAEFRDLARTLNELQEVTMRTRMVPVRTVVPNVKRAVRDVARHLGKEVVFESAGEETELDRRVLDQLAEALLHLVRNSVDHGIETAEERVAAGKTPHGNLKLHAMQIGSEVIISLTDDGRGIDVPRVRTEAERRGVDSSAMSDEEAIYLIFRSGMSTAKFISDISGRGVGLDVVRAQVENVRGRIEVNSVPGQGSEFRIMVPITLAILPCLLVEAGGQTLALPLHSVITALARGAVGDAHAEGHAVVVVNGKPVPIAGLASTLGIGEDAPGPVVVLAGLTRSHAFVVDRLLGQRGVVVKGLSRALPKLDVLAGASVEPDGSILLVLDVGGLIDRARRGRRAATNGHMEPGAKSMAPTARVLVVDDALTVRELEKNILEQAGYHVATAVDGAQALAMLAETSVDIVLTDVEMPRLDGFALTEAIRAHPKLSNLPVLILTSRSSEEDRRRGLDVGADGYIVKSSFDQAALLGAVERILGSRR